jgi:hypothetical protein
MNGISDWMQSYWFELGSLSLQFATLVALVWFARNVLRIMARSQGRVEAPQHAAEAAVIEESSFRDGLRGLLPMDPAPTFAPTPAAVVRPERPNLWQATIKWLNTPVGNAPMAWRRYHVRRTS